MTARQTRDAWTRALHPAQVTATYTHSVIAPTPNQGRVLRLNLYGPRHDRTDDEAAARLLVHAPHETSHHWWPWPRPATLTEHLPRLALQAGKWTWGHASVLAASAFTFGVVVYNTTLNR